MVHAINSIATSYVLKTLITQLSNNPSIPKKMYFFFIRFLPFLWNFMCYLFFDSSFYLIFYKQKSE